MSFDDEYYYYCYIQSQHNQIPPISKAEFIKKFEFESTQRISTQCPTILKKIKCLFTNEYETSSETSPEIYTLMFINNFFRNYKGFYNLHIKQIPKIHYDVIKKNFDEITCTIKTYFEKETEKLNAFLDIKYKKTVLDIKYKNSDGFFNRFQKICVPPA